MTDVVNWIAAIASIALVLVTFGLVYYTYVLGSLARELNRIENRRDRREQFQRDRAQIWSPLHSMCQQALKFKDDWLRDVWLNEDSLFFLLKPHFLSRQYSEPRRDVEELKALRDTAKASYSELEEFIKLSIDNAVFAAEPSDKTEEISRFLTKEFKETVCRELFVPVLLDSIVVLEERLAKFDRDRSFKGHTDVFNKFFRSAWSIASDNVRQARDEFEKCRDDFFSKMESIDTRLEATLLAEGEEVVQ